MDQKTKEKIKDCISFFAPIVTIVTIGIVIGLVLIWAVICTAKVTGIEYEADSVKLRRIEAKIDELTGRIDELQTIRTHGDDSR